MDDLRMFLENEGWELCPVKSTFHILNLVVSLALHPNDPKYSDKQILTNSVDLDQCIHSFRG